MGSSSVCGNEDPGMNVSVATMASSASVQGWQRILGLASSRLMVGGTLRNHTRRRSLPSLKMALLLENSALHCCHLSPLTLRSE